MATAASTCVSHGNRMHAPPGHTHSSGTRVRAVCGVAGQPWARGTPTAKAGDPGPQNPIQTPPALGSPTAPHM